MRGATMRPIKRFLTLPVLLFLIGGSLIFLVAPALRMLTASAASEDPAKYEVSELRYQGWTGQVLFPELAEDLGYLAPIRLKWVGNTISGPQDIQSVVTGGHRFRRCLQRVDRKAG